MSGGLQIKYIIPADFNRKSSDHKDGQASLFVCTPKKMKIAIQLSKSGQGQVGSAFFVSEEYGNSLFPNLGKRSILHLRSENRIVTPIE